MTTILIYFQVDISLPKSPAILKNKSEHPQ